MTTRDRWTVYPLLFLALGAALRSKITSTIDVESLASRRMEATQFQAAQVTAKSILCDDLQINDKDGKPRVRLGTTRANTAGIEIYGRDGKILAVLTVDPETNLARLRLQTADGARQVVIGSDNDGGIVETQSKTGQPRVLIHSTSSGGVVTTIDAAGKVRVEPDDAAPPVDPAEPAAK